MSNVLGNIIDVENITNIIDASQWISNTKVNVKELDYYSLVFFFT